MIKEEDVILKHLMFVPKIDEVKTTFNKNDVPALNFGMSQVYEASVIVRCEVRASSAEHAIKNSVECLNNALYRDTIARVMDIQRANQKPHNQDVVHTMLQDLMYDMMGR